MSVNFLWPHLVQCLDPRGVGPESFLAQVGERNATRTILMIRRWSYEKLPLSGEKGTQVLIHSWGMGTSDGLRPVNRTLLAARGRWLSTRILHMHCRQFSPSLQTILPADSREWRRQQQKGKGGSNK